MEKTKSQYVYGGKNGGLLAFLFIVAILCIIWGIKAWYDYGWYSEPMYCFAMAIFLLLIAVGNIIADTLEYNKMAERERLFGNENTRPRPTEEPVKDNHNPEL